jgi:hypothetical protein
MKVIRFITIMVTLVSIARICETHAADYFPLSEGTVHQFQVKRKYSYRSGEEYSRFEKVLPSRVLDGKQLIPVLINSKDLTFFLENEIGVARYAVQQPLDPEPRIASKANYELKYPLKVGSSWTIETLTFLLSENFRVSCTAMIETLDDVVTVPAGKFEKCLKVRTAGRKPLGEADTPQGSLMATVEMYSWYAPGVGMIKRVARHGFKDEKSEHFGEITIQLSSYNK